MRKVLLGCVVAVGLFLFSYLAYATAYNGKIETLSIAYDGTVVLVLGGWVSDDCTCFSGWPNYMCLDKARPSYRDEYAMLLSAKARDKEITMIIDEPSCKVVAIEEH